MTRDDAIEDGGFIKRRCVECDSEFWSDDSTRCEMCRIGHIGDDERRQEEEIEVLDWDSLLQTGGENG